MRKWIEKVVRQIKESRKPNSLFVEVYFNHNLNAFFQGGVR